MPVFKDRSVLTNIPVKEAMRRQPNRLRADATLAVCIRLTIKLKINTVLVDDPKGYPIGVVSKTDIMGAYYAGLPVESPLSDILAGLSSRLLQASDWVPYSSRMIVGNRRAQFQKPI